MFGFTVLCATRGSVDAVSVVVGGEFKRNEGRRGRRRLRVVCGVADGSDGVVTR